MAGEVLQRATVRWSIVAALVAVQIALSASWVAPGPLSIDEVTYHRMTRDLVAGRGLAIWNGYEEHPSRELESMYVRPADGRLVAQYPYGWPVLAAPAYAALGYRGLFVLNALAFIGVLLLIRRVAVQLLADERVALGACALFAGGTFAWEYSMAAWPHMTAMLLTTAAFSLLVSAWQTPPGRRSAALAAAAGLAMAAAATLRLDALFCAPLLAVPLLFGRTSRFRDTLALGAGMVPGLAFLSATNLARWGNPSPLSYGRGGGLSELARYAPLAVAGVALVAVAWVVTRPRARELAQRRRLELLGAGVVLLALALLIPSTRGLLLRLARGAHVILVDVRGLPLDKLEPAMERTTDGAVIYWGAFKKSLVQSLPYLPLLLIAVARAIRRPNERAAIALLFGIPITFAAFYSFSTWHGGLCLNMRYLLPALPFTSILIALAVRELASGADGRWWVWCGAAIAVAIFGYAVLEPPGDRLGALGAFLLDLPLGLAALTAVAMLSWMLRPGRSTATGTLVIGALALGWSGAVAFDYDASWSHRRRTIHYSGASSIAPLLPDDALLLSDAPDTFYGVVEYRPMVRIAVPWNDEFADAAELVDYHLRAGRPVYGIMVARSWHGLRASGALEGKEVRAVGRLGPFELGQIGVGPDSGTRIEP